jgi:BMFP domain-containing protein YqiC
MNDIIQRIEARLSVNVDNPIISDILVKARTEIARLRDKVDALEAEKQLLKQVSNYNR